MGIENVKAIRYTCDGCGSEFFTDSDEPPVGNRIDWFTIDPTGGSSGRLWICKDTCLTKAFKRRYELTDD